MSLYSNRRRADCPLTTIENFSDYDCRRVGGVARRRRMQFCGDHGYELAQSHSLTTLGTALSITRNMIAPDQPFAAKRSCDGHLAALGASNWPCANNALCTCRRFATTAVT